MCMKRLCVLRASPWRTSSRWGVVSGEHRVGGERSPGSAGGLVVRRGNVDAEQVGLVSLPPDARIVREVKVASDEADAAAQGRGQPAAELGEVAADGGGLGLADVEVVDDQEETWQLGGWLRKS